MRRRDVAGQSGMEKVGIHGKKIGGLVERRADMTVLVRRRMVSEVEWANRWKRWRRGGGRSWMQKRERTSHTRANGGYRPFALGYQFRLSTAPTPPLRKDVQRRALPGCATTVGRIGSLRRFIGRSSCTSSGENSSFWTRRKISGGTRPAPYVGSPTAMSWQKPLQPDYFTGRKRADYQCVCWRPRFQRSVIPFTTYMGISPRA
jgi:hypothetical protein